MNAPAKLYSGISSDVKESIPNGEQLYSNYTSEKIKSFSRLKYGDMYGNSLPIHYDVRVIAIELIGCAELSRVETDAFPGLCGDIIFMGYYEDLSLEVTINRDLTINILLEREDIELYEKEGVSKEEASAIFLQPKLWSSLESYIGSIGIEKKKDSNQSHSNPVATHSYQSSSLNVYRYQIKPSANTYQGFIRQIQAGQYTGDLILRT